MSCPFSDAELEKWDSICNPMGDECYSCTDFDCDHNENYEENPNFVPFTSGDEP